MRYFTIPSPPHLSKYIRCFWVLEGEASAKQPYIHRTMADGCCELIFHYKGVFDEIRPDESCAQSITAGLAGQILHYRNYRIHENFGLFGVYLFPFAIGDLLGIPVTEFRDQLIDFDDFKGSDVEGLKETVLMAKDHAARVNLVSRFFEKRLKKVNSVPVGILETTQYIIERKGQVEVKELASKNFLSLRQFERNFKYYSGISPKLFTRIVRFQSTLEEYGNNEKSMTTIAYDAGYYDQSHFNHDFKQFSGYNPLQFFSGKTLGSEWREF